jgi:hypothetical protein
MAIAFHAPAAQWVLTVFGGEVVDVNCPTIIDVAVNRQFAGRGPTLQEVTYRPRRSTTMRNPGQILAGPAAGRNWSGNPKRQAVTVLGRWCTAVFSKFGVVGCDTRGAAHSPRQCLKLTGGVLGRGA